MLGQKAQPGEIMRGRRLGPREEGFISPLFSLQELSFFFWPPVPQFSSRQSIEPNRSERLTFSLCHLFVFIPVSSQSCRPKYPFSSRLFFFPHSQCSSKPLWNLCVPFSFCPSAPQSSFRWVLFLYPLCDRMFPSNLCVFILALCALKVVLSPLSSGTVSLFPLCCNPPFLDP